MLLFYDANNNAIEKEIFNSNHDFDELVIITGYITPSYITRIFNDFHGKIKIFLGMGDGKYKSSTYNSIKAILSDMDNRLSFYYTDNDVHAKIYIWKNHSGNKSKILIGSANFSDSIGNPYKEVLGTIDSDEQFNKYVDHIKEHSTEFSQIQLNRIRRTQPSSRPLTTPVLIGDNGALLSLLSSKEGRTPNIAGIKSRKNGVHSASGVNWGFSNGLNNLNDASIPIPMELVRNTRSMFKIPKADQRIFKAIWDDGTKMDIQFEGNNVWNGERYPKQVASYDKKNIMGIYLRKRIGAKLGKELVVPDHLVQAKRHKTLTREQKRELKKYYITTDDLRNYGRYDVEITDMGDGSYYFDFSV